MNEILTQARLKELVLYDRNTGIFTWKASRIGCRKGDTAGCTNKHIGYKVIGIDKKLYMLHRLAWLYEHGELPKDQIDHINQNKLDNRIYNLREATYKTNGKNVPIGKANTSGTIGVSFNKKHKIWRANIKVNQKQITLGSFINKNDAIEARKHAEKLYGFHENHGQRKHYG